MIQELAFKLHDFVVNNGELVEKTNNKVLRDETYGCGGLLTLISTHSYTIDMKEQLVLVTFRSLFIRFALLLQWEPFTRISVIFGEKPFMIGITNKPRS